MKKDNVRGHIRKVVVVVVVVDEEWGEVQGRDSDRYDADRITTDFLEYLYNQLGHLDRFRTCRFRAVRVATHMHEEHRKSLYI